MLFDVPKLGEKELGVVHQIDDLRRQLRWQLHEPRRWYGSLRRQTFARVIQGSNSIEGYTAALDDVIAAADGEETLDADRETELALKGYRDAMTYVLQLANEPEFEYSEQLIKSLQFMMTSYDLNKRPGLYRAGAIFVRNDDSGEVVYEGPDVEFVPKLMTELVDSLNEPNAELPSMVRAGMAHLDLVMIHPFRDGNGRMARCLQTLVMAQDGHLTPVFSSIEEYLGRNTPAYYDILARVGNGHWDNRGDALPWIRFVLTAHLRQARTLLRRIKESERLWDALERVVSDHGLPDRLVPALFDAASRFRIRNSTYRAMQSEEDEISEQTASRDLTRAAHAGLLVPHGERRGRFYTGSAEVREIRDAIRRSLPGRDDDDPFASS